MSRAFDLFLFSTNPRRICECVAAGVAGVVIDWERAGKAERQRDADTEINEHTVEDLRRVRAATAARILCRLNRVGATTAVEIEEAIAAGADEILLPMVRTVEEVSAALALVRGRCGVGILIETVAAVQRAEALCRLPLARVYVGLNDLTIDRGDACLFAPVLDGTVERLRSTARMPFGFAGMTIVQRGWPVPSRLLISELARLRCDFTFLRRSFHRDIRWRLVSQEVPAMLCAVGAAGRRPPEAVERDRRDLNESIRQAMTDRAGSLFHSP